MVLLLAPKLIVVEPCSIMSAFVIVTTPDALIAKVAGSPVKVTAAPRVMFVPPKNIDAAVNVNVDVEKDPFVTVKFVIIAKLAPRVTVDAGALIRTEQSVWPAVVNVPVPTQIIEHILPPSSVVLVPRVKLVPT